MTSNTNKRKMISARTVLKVLLSFSLLSSTTTYSQAVGDSATAVRNVPAVGVNSKLHTTLVEAIHAAGLNEALKDKMPFTVFAPTNTAFNKLPKQSMNMLMKPENKQALANILTYHIITTKIPGDSLIALIKRSGGTYRAKTLQGGELSFSMVDKNVVITDGKGGVSKAALNPASENYGLMYTIDTVLMPK